MLLRNVERRADGWTVLLDGLRDGPDGLAISGGMYDRRDYTPPDGQRYLWAFMEIRNDLGRDHVFDYDRCDLDLDGRRVVPTVISRYKGPTAELQRTESFSPGEVSHRILLFTYPVGRLPTR